MKRLTLALITTIIGTASVASARRIPAPMREYAEPSVTTVSTYQQGRTMYRAITGIEGRRPYLVLEELAWNSRPRGRVGRNDSSVRDDREDVDVRDRYDDRGGRRGSLVVRVQRPITSVAVGRRRVDIERFRYLTIESWGNNQLTFSAATARASYRCAISLTNNATGATCEGRWQEDGPPGYPGGGYDGGGINPGAGNPGGGYPGGGYPGGGYDGSGINPAPGGGNAGDLERLRVTTEACGNVFYAKAQRDSCIQTVLNVDIELTPAIAACGQALVGSDDKLACLTLAATFRGDAPATIKQCAASFSGARDQLTCFRTAAAQSLPLAVIPACADAVIGAQDRLRCMSTVAGARIEPVALIGYCKQNNVGSSNILRCLAQYR